jgi:hypothetical protein
LVGAESQDVRDGGRVSHAGQRGRHVGNDWIAMPPHHSGLIEIVSAKSLSKTGISAVLSGDFPEFLVKVAASFNLRD